MGKKVSPADLRVDGTEKFRLKKFPQMVEPTYENKGDYKDRLRELTGGIDEQQQMMYAHDRYSMLLVFQAMDAAGKDGTIRRMIRGVDPHGVAVESFKKPSDEELDHDFLWRTSKALPRRGNMTVFNRSYYEEVLIVKVHPEILTKYQRVPAGLTGDLSEVWEGRYQSIRDHEAHLARNGTKVVKFFLNISKDEQCRRFVDRIDRPEKNWKFNEGDVSERAYWDDYMVAYEEAINATATEEAPWFIIPADDKMTMRLLVAEIIRDEMRKLDICYPKVDDERSASLQGFRADLTGES